MEIANVGSFNAANRALSPVTETDSSQGGGKAIASAQVSGESRPSQTPPPPPPGALAEEENTSQDRAPSGNTGGHRVDIRV